MDFTISFIKLFGWSIYLVAPLLIFLSIVIILLGQFVGKKEKWTVFDAFYWSLITATTVGYGDIRPVEKTSRIFSILIALIGIVFTGIIVAVALNTSSIALEKHLDKDIIKKMKKI